MSDHPKVTVLLTIFIIAAALFAGMFYLGRTPNRANDKAKLGHNIVPAGTSQ